MVTMIDNTVLYNWNLLIERNECSHNKQINKVMDVLINYMGEILSQYICMSNHHDIL